MQSFYRYEWKYSIPIQVAEAIHKYVLMVGMRPDPNHVDGYTVTSLYFDSHHLDDYADKMAGLIDRKKIRVRIYTPTLSEATKEIWLEKKIKHDALVTKERILLKQDELYELLAGSRISLIKTLKKHEEKNAQSILNSIFSMSMRPHAIVRYQRLPFISRHSDLRITIDSRIEACLNTNLRYTPFMTPVCPEQVVLEIKSLQAFPYWLKLLLSTYNLSRTTFSKYAEAVDVLYRYQPIPR